MRAVQAEQGMLLGLSRMSCCETCVASVGFGGTKRSRGYCACFGALRVLLYEPHIRWWLPHFAMCRLDGQDGRRMMGIVSQLQPLIVLC